MNNKEQQNGPRRLNPEYGRRSDLDNSYESDSSALTTGTGRNIRHRSQQPNSPIGMETSYQDELEYYDEDDFYTEIEDDPSEAFNPNKAHRDLYEFEPLDDDLVNYDEFGRKRKQPRIKEEKYVTKSRVVWGWVISIIVAVLIAFIIRGFFFEIIVVEGDSMRPTLETNEKLAVEKVSRYFGLPEHGDIIIVHYPNMEGTYVKRVIALPGETVEVKESTVFVNGQALTEPYINDSEAYIDMAPIVVPEETVFVMGDNRAHSLDSRTASIGPIAHSEIVGHAMAVIWPFDNIHSVE